MLDELEAEEGANTRFHHSLQRVLVKAAFAPMMLTESSEHPLRIVLQKLLAVRELPATSASITHHRIRFATHLGLALVSLGAMPGSPGTLFSPPVAPFARHVCSPSSLLSRYDMQRTWIACGKRSVTHYLDGC